MASPNLSELVTTTLRNRSRKLADNVSNNNALLQRLQSRGNVRPFSGGRNIVQELEYAENGSYRRYSGYETLDISPSDVFTAAEFDIKQAAVAVSISGLEMLQNSGREQMIDLLDSRIRNAERSAMNNFSGDVYSDGTATNQIGGLQHLIADDPSSGTVGGIARGTWSFWQNGYYDMSSGLAAASAGNIQSGMNALYLSIARGPDKPDLIVADNNYFKHYWESLQSIQRITSDGEGQAGFQSLKFMGADVIFDGGYGGDAPASTMYMLNTDYIFLRPHRDRNWTPIEPDRYGVNQDAMVKLIGFAGNLAMSNAFVQGVLHE